MAHYAVLWHALQRFGASFEHAGFVQVSGMALRLAVIGMIIKS
jgi:hypothetical protein